MIALWRRLQAFDRYAARMAGLVLLGGGGFLAWAGLVPLQEGVAGGGFVTAETDRQVVQHLEGGIIESLMVSEGEAVEAGQPLVRLRTTASLARRDQVVQTVAALRASAARLGALRAGAPAPDFAGLDGLALGALERADIVERETALFEEQRGALAAEIEVLEARRLAALDAAQNRSGRIAIARRSLVSTREELALRRELFAEQLARRDEVSRIEREVAAIESDVARLDAERADAEAQARDAEGRIAQARARFAEGVSDDLLRVRAELQAAEEELAAVQDVLDRTVVRAPAAGEVLNLAFRTEGGVIAPGAPILEIVPETGWLTATVRVRPADRAGVREGQRVRMRVTAWKRWDAPVLFGEILSVSADLKSDPATGAVFYEARVRAAPEPGERPPEAEPGMPVEVFIFSGRSRTTLEYLFEPIAASLFRGMRTG